MAAPFLMFALGRRGVWATAGLVAVFLVARALFIGRTCYRTLRAFERNRCPRCGYDTRANAGRCPECGEELLPQAAAYWHSFLG